MTYESWREQVEEGEQKARQAEIGNVFLIDRGEEPRSQADEDCTALSFYSNVFVFLQQMWTLSLLYVHKLSTRGWWTIYSGSNAVSIGRQAAEVQSSIVVGIFCFLEFFLLLSTDPKT